LEIFIMKAARPLISLLEAICLIGAPLPAFAADAAAKPAATEKQPSVSKPILTIPHAIVALQKEYQAYAKDPQANKIRAKSDYFKENPAPDATAESILKALEGSVAGGPGAQAYVKWQLLSAVPDKFPDDLVKRAIAVYRRAPSPIEHPGLERRSLNKLVNGLRKEQVAPTQREFDQALEQVKEANHPVLAYRNELYNRLPLKLEALYAGLEDINERGSRGLNVTAIFDNVSAGIRSWAISQASSAQVRSMIDTILRLRDSMEANKPFTKIDAESKPVKWKAEGGLIDPKKVDELVKFLENNAAGSGAGGLKFKDPKK
jgi:hypothetical protein